MLDIYLKEDWIKIYSRYIEGEFLSIPDIAKYLGIGYKVMLGIFNRFNFEKLSTAETTKRCLVKNKETKKLKYGDENYNNIEKMFKTKEKVYGSRNYANIEKIKATKKLRYNNENYNNIEKISDTCLKRHGDKNYRNLEKTKATKKLRYDNEYYLNTEKAKKTKKLRHGDENYNNREKAKETTKVSYGVDNVAKSEKVKSCMRNTIIHKTIEEWTDSYLTPNNYILLSEYKGAQNYNDNGDYDSWKKYNFVHNTCGTEFLASFNGDNIRCPKCFPNKFGRSEQELNDYIESLGFDTITKSFELISPQQIDVFIPDLDTGFEYNGTVFHSALFGKEQYYHRDKTESALSKGIKLYHVWEYCNEEIVKSMICGILNKNINNLHARKLQIKQVNSKERQLFFDINHLHGDVKASFALGLYQDTELISCISFRKHKEGIEIARFATKLYNRVRGGFSKLLKHSINYIKDNYPEINKIITYCDRDWTPDYKDSVYYKNGFNFVKDSGCMLSYYKNNKVYSRETFQKHKLKELFPDNYDENKTADEILIENKIYPIYNSGNWKFELTL